MHILREVLHDFLHFLIAVDWGCAVVLMAMGVRATFLRMGEYFERSGSLFSLRSPLPSEFSKKYYFYFSQSIWLGLAFAATLALGVILLWINDLFFPSLN